MPKNPPLKKKKLDVARVANRPIPIDLSKSTGKVALLPLGAIMLAGLSTLPALAETANTEKTKELSTINVQADVDKPDGLRATATRVGKVLQDPHDVPQAITTITKAMLEEQQVGSLKEALRNVSGLSFNAAEGGRSGDNVNLRGFYTFGDMYLDGIRDTAQYNRETFNLEQIDVLRGAGAMLFGRGQAGGVINQVSKIAQRAETYKLTGSLGTDGYQQASADLNTPFNEHTALRINAVRRDEGSWRNNPTTGTEPEIKRQGLALSLGLNMLTDNQFWINHYRLHTNDNPDYGIAFNPATRAPSSLLPAHYYWGSAHTFDKSDTVMTTLINEYRISPDSQIRTQLRLADYQRSYWAKTPNLMIAPDALGAVGGNQTRTSSYQTVTLQSDLNTKFQLLGIKHELLTGIEYLREDSYRKALNNYGNVAAPDYRPYQEALTGNPISFTSNSYAIYAQDSVEFIPKWKLTAGVRRDEMDANYNSITSPNLRYGENSYRSSLSYHPADNSHYYLSYSSSFSPTADLYQLTVVPQPPETSDVVELGAKLLLMGGDLALRAALYQATKHWERNADLEAVATILTKKRRTNGIELEATGRINDRWEIFAGLSLMNAKILEVAQNISPITGDMIFANPEYAGKTARNSPPYTINVWTNYQLTSHWKIGGGIEAKGERQAFNPSSGAAVPTLNGVYHPNTAPAYARWDAMIAYEQKQWVARMNIKNLFDHLYYDALYDNGSFTVPSSRRMIIVTVEYKL